MEFPVMIEFLRSNAGLFWQYSLAALFQLVGVVLVVRDLMRTTKNDRLLQRNLAVLSKVKADIPEDMEPFVAEKVESGDLHPEVAATTLSALNAGAQAEGAWLVLDQIIGHANATKEPKKWLVWAGLSSLLLGIVFAFYASVFAVR